MSTTAQAARHWRPRTPSHGRNLAVALLLSVVVMILAAGIRPADAKATDNGYGEAVPASGTAAQAIDTPSSDEAGGTVDTVNDIGPVYSWRWHWQALSNICVENHSTFPLQNIVAEWSEAEDLYLSYEHCDNVPYWSRIDVHETYNTARPSTCYYSYLLLDDNQRVYRMIIYLNKAATPCWVTYIRKNHWSSAAVGGGLGLRTFDTYPPTYVAVMRRSSQDSVSYPQAPSGSGPAGDKRTFSWFNNCYCQA